MSNKLHGGPAFPSPAANLRNDGMNLRDWFAGQVIQGYAATEYYADPNNGGYSTARWLNDDQMARAAYAVADAMLKARQ